MPVLFVLALIGTACAVPRQSTRIVGGESTTIENYPFTANMLYSSPAGLFPDCGGTLITSTAVVSAAHCYGDDPPSTLKVRLGSTFANSGGYVHTVSRIILHEQYNARLVTNDVTVVKLINPAVLSNQINIARIAGPQYILSDNTVVHAIGWGTTKHQGESSEVLQHVAVHIINQKICTERYAYLKTQPNMSRFPDVTLEMICTGILDVGGKDACQGDSGGPVIHNRNILIGINSWGYTCGHPSYPGVNVRVSSYTDWIYNNSLN